MEKLNRRDFLIGMSSGVAASRIAGLGGSYSPILFATPELKNPWYQKGLSTQCDRHAHCRLGSEILIGVRCENIC